MRERFFGRFCGFWKRVYNLRKPATSPLFVRTGSDILKNKKMNLSLVFSKMGISPAVGQDVTLFLALLLLSFIFGMLIGRYKLITILINIYVSVAVLSVVPKEYVSDYSSELVLFFLLLVGLTLISKRLFEIYISGSGSGFLWRVFAMSFLEVLFLMSVIFSIIPEKEALGYVSRNAYDLLASENARIFWMVSPMVFMFFIHKRLNR